MHTYVNVCLSFWVLKTKITLHISYKQKNNDFEFFKEKQIPYFKENKKPFLSFAYQNQNKFTFVKIKKKKNVLRSRDL